MIKSMTGYGSGKCIINGKKFSVEIRAINHRYNDLSVKIPRAMLAFEEPVRKLVASKVSRGKTDVFINFESTAPEDNLVVFNEILGDNLYSALEKMKERYSFSENIGLSLLYKFPNVMTYSKNEELITDEDGELWQALRGALDAALESFIAMRENEGQAIKVDLMEKIKSIAVTTAKIEQKAPLVADEYRTKLDTRLKELLGESVDEQRLIAEVAIYADKSSIDEELIRLKSHIKQFGDIVEEKRPVGKKLDFLIQEMLRETNTIGSKSNNIEITQDVIALKADIEKIREQIQNVE